MSDLNKKFLLHAVNFGLIIAGVLVVLQLITYIFDIDVFSIAFSILYQLVTIVFITWMMAYSAIKFRDKHQEGRIRFVQCFLMAVIAGVLSTVILALYNYVFYAFFDPDALREIADKTMEMIDSNPNIPDEQKAEILQNMEERFTPEKTLVQSLMYMGIMSVILALISTLFVRKKEKTVENVY